MFEQACERAGVPYEQQAADYLVEVLHRQSGMPLLPAYPFDVVLKIRDRAIYEGTGPRLSPEALAEFTRGVLECMTRAIHASGGTLDKYIGDGVLAFWGAPLTVPDHADLALEAALGIRRELATLNAARAAAGQAPVVVRLGINTGEVVVGDLGTRFRRTYTAMGEAVNLAHRLQVLAREHREFALVGPGTAAQARRVALEAFGEVQLRGLSQPQRVFRLAGVA